MKPLILLIAALLFALPAHAQEEKGAIAPLGHFVFAAAGQYSIAHICERIRSGERTDDTGTWRKKPGLGCQLAGFGVVALVATMERRGAINEDFSSRDFWADIAGASFSAIVIEW